MVVLSLVASAATSAKENRPGELRICGLSQCHAVNDPARARAFAELLWGQSRVARASMPPTGSPVFQVRFRDWPGAAVALITRTAIRVHGLNCERFQRGEWYRLPTRLRGMTSGLEPRRLRARVPRSC
jgi:hypothetical protein